MAALNRKTGPTTLATVRDETTGEVIAKGRVTLASFERGRNAVLRELAAQKRQPMSTTDTPLVAQLKDAKRQRKADTLADLQERVDRIEQALGLGKHRRAAPMPFDPAVMPPPPPAA